MSRQSRKLTHNLFFVSILLLRCPTLSSAGIIKDQQSQRLPWNQAKDAYRPNPILFLHGFAAEEPKKTWLDKAVDEKLNEYFSRYYTQLDKGQKPILALPGTQKDPQTRHPYLEILSFIDFAGNQRSQLIDRNSSVDTYQVGDRYVNTRERAVGSVGWADTLNETIQKLRTVYVDRYGKPLKVTLICHSMGGLAAREFLTNPKYSRALEMVDKLILIGVPNFGSPLAPLTQGILRVQSIG